VQAGLIELNARVDKLHDKLSLHSAQAASSGPLPAFSEHYDATRAVQQQASKRPAQLTPHTYRARHGRFRTGVGARLQGSACM
jgi:hypothetical protein